MRDVYFSLSCLWQRHVLISCAQRFCSVQSVHLLNSTPSTVSKLRSILTCTSFLHYEAENPISEQFSEQVFNVALYEEARLMNILFLLSCYLSHSFVQSQIGTLSPFNKE